VSGWFAKSFVSTETVTITDNSAVGVSAPLSACGLATVPVDVVVTVHVDHPRPQDLTISVEDPNGMIIELLSGASEIPNVMVGGFPGDDMVNGVWTLTVKDSVAGEVGTLKGWSIYLLSNWD
jgi:subtilisin-like proprotein convertase family protein